MGFLKKKTDPISDRSRALNAQIASLEAQIRKLDGKLQQGATQNRLRAPSGSPARGAARRPAAAREPIFEPVDQSRLEPSGNGHGAEHYNDLGIRKYDLAGAWGRFRSHFRGPPASNPKLVTYLAAGSIKGLRPLRYEKRIARNRFIALAVMLALLVWGILVVFVRGR